MFYGVNSVKATGRRGWWREVERTVTRLTADCSCVCVCLALRLIIQVSQWCYNSIDWWFWGFRHMHTKQRIERWIRSDINVVPMCTQAESWNENWGLDCFSFPLNTRQNKQKKWCFLFLISFFYVLLFKASGERTLVSGRQAKDHEFWFAPVHLSDITAAAVVAVPILAKVMQEEWMLEMKSEN